MILNKHFVFDQHKGLQCTNMDDVNTYVTEKINIFCDYNNYVDKSKKLNLLQEIIDMYNEDILNKDVDITGIQHVKYHDKIDQNQMYMYYDFIIILGSIICHVFDYDKNALKCVEDGVNGPIDMAKMVEMAYKEFHDAKVNNTVACGATLMFVTIFESELKRKFKTRFLHKKANEIERLISNGTITLTTEQRDLLDMIEDKPNHKTFNNVYATTQAAYELFNFSGVLDNPTEQKSLLLNQTTLNQLLGYSFFRNEVEPAFLQVAEYLFKTTNLNLRNDMAHGGFGYKNYFHLSATGVLFFMCTFVFNDDCWI